MPPRPERHRPVTELKDAAVLSYLHREDARPRAAGVTGLTCAQIRDGINAYFRFPIVNNEVVYNSLLRLEREGKVERHPVNSRLVGWTATVDPFAELVNLLHQG